MLELILPILLAGFILSGILTYFGSHIIRRGIIFVDLALAQTVAMGFALAMRLGMPQNSHKALALALACALVVSLVFSALGKISHLVNPEAFIGFIYVLMIALTFIALAKVPDGLEEIEHLLNGNILYAGYPELLRAFGLFFLVGLFHLKFHNKFYEENQSFFWNFLFFLTFSLVVINAVTLGGVFLTFSFLIITALSGFLFSSKTWVILIIGWIIGIFATILGALLSFKADLPASPAIIVLLGGIFLICLVFKLRKFPEKNTGSGNR